VLNQDELKIDIPLMVDPADPIKMKPSVRGKESLTLLKVMNRYRVATLIEVELVTGRHHQIRAHCAAIGHPLLVDELYGTSEAFFVSTIKKRFNLKKNDEERPVISRVSMHSSSIAFRLPSTGEEAEFKSGYPKDFQALIQVLDKYASASGRRSIY
jgi:23S rRNA-/tRNA-specific pseudouridylate synthase